MSKTNLEYLIDSENLTGDTLSEALCDLNGYSKCIDCAKNSSCHDCYARNVEWLLEEHKEQILTDAEREYLSAVIKPFRSRVKFIAIFETFSKENHYVYIELNGRDEAGLPTFKPNTMYKGMTLNKHYTLEELGL